MTNIKQISLLYLDDETQNPNSNNLETEPCTILSFLTDEYSDVSKEYISNYMVNEWIPEQIEKIYKKEKTNYVSRCIFSDYIEYVKYNCKLSGIMTELAKKYNVSKQWVSVVINKYIKLLKKEIEVIL